MDLLKPARRALAALVLGLASSVPLGLPAAADATGTQAVDWAPETFTLANGMEVVVLPDHRAPVVTHMVWYKVGAVDEAPGKSGIAHLFEHVMFQETDDIGPEEFTSIVQRNGGQLNAFTSWDYTAYFERVAKQHLELMMELEAERMTDLIINDDPEGPFISERDVVKEERRQRIENNPGSILFEQVMAALYPDHPYGIPIIGFMDEVAALSPQDGLDFYETWYAPEHALLIIAGDITAEEVRPIAERTYGQIPQSGRARPDRGWRGVAPLTDSVTLTHRDPKVRQPEWDRYYLATSFTRDEDKAYALAVGLDVLGGGLTSKLYQALVEEQKVAVAASAWGFLSLHDTGPAGLSATPAEGVSLETLEAAMLAEVARVLEEGLSEEDVIRSRNALAARYIYARDSQSGMANLYGRNLAIGRTVEDILEYPDRVRAVTAEAATAALREVFAADRPYVEAHLLPEGDF